MVLGRREPWVFPALPFSLSSLIDFVRSQCQLFPLTGPRAHREEEPKTHTTGRPGGRSPTCRATTTGSGEDQRFPSWSWEGSCREGDHTIPTDRGLAHCEVSAGGEHAPFATPPPGGKTVSLGSKTIFPDNQEAQKVTHPKLFEKSHISHANHHIP